MYYEFYYIISNIDHFDVRHFFLISQWFVSFFVILDSLQEVISGLDPPVKLK